MREETEPPLRLHHIHMPHTSFRLRPARPADLPTLFAIDHACFSDDIAYSRQELLWAMLEPHALSLIAEVDEGDAAGFLLAARDRPKIAHIITIDVLPQYRQRGIGNGLMNAAEHHYGQQGAESMRLEAAINNLSALKFYHQRGYRVIKTLPGYYPGNLDGLLLQKDGLPGRLPADAETG